MTPRYGLEVIRHLEETSDLVLLEGTVYPILARLTRDGLLEAEWNSEEASHPRKYYRLTERGRRRLGDDDVGMARVRAHHRAAHRRPRTEAAHEAGDAGEARLRGYLFVLRQTLRSFLPRDTAQDAVREIESHLREAIAAADGAPNEAVALERILAELGTPAQVARGYSLEMTLDEAAATAGLLPICRALLRLASTTVLGFFAVLGLFAGYAWASPSWPSPCSSRSSPPTSGSSS